MGKKLVLRQVVQGNEAEFMITDESTSARVFFRTGIDTPTIMPGTTMNTTTKSRAVRYWVLDDVSKLVTPEGKTLQVGYKGDYLVEVAGQELRIVKKDDFANYFN